MKLGEEATAIVSYHKRLMASSNLREQSYQHQIFLNLWIVKIWFEWFNEVEE